METFKRSDYTEQISFKISKQNYKQIKENIKSANEDTIKENGKEVFPYMSDYLRSMLGIASNIPKKIKMSKHDMFLITNFTIIGACVLDILEKTKEDMIACQGTKKEDDYFYIWHKISNLYSQIIPLMELTTNEAINTFGEKRVDQIVDSCTYAIKLVKETNHDVNRIAKVYKEATNKNVSGFVRAYNDDVEKLYKQLEKSLDVMKSIERDTDDVCALHYAREERLKIEKYLKENKLI